MLNQKPKNIILFFRQELASITVLPNHTKCPVWKPKKPKYCTKLQINTNLGKILIKFLIFRNIIIQRGDFPSKFLDFISLTCFRVFPQYRLDSKTVATLFFIYLITTRRAGMSALVCDTVRPHCTLSLCPGKT